ncbi:bifunctional diguanylate cyclase/phosphodiesterase [Photobacterium lucens]|uniref:bifunctional diguanylate cyclase/phosphodiesterase n=1 Tax=Photobacterium lucens TaxID=2562949 RepID=UPI00136C863D|nr:EAL domain-containing protein [Photobacterium lucens]MBP2700357.1 EAL domain-containing protein [Vibrio parahaemolyticus]MZG56768.1 EAL domain-containing protein [Photobacterium lucens]MZG81983.1 EAL domain-containing protein [Photobacterium lucens]
MVTALKALKRNQYGKDFISHTMQSIFNELQPDHYYIAYFNKSCSKATSLAYYIDGVITDSTISYLLDDVPCRKVLESGAIYLIEDHAYSAYPKDKLMVEQQFESYLGIPIISPHDDVIGIVVCLFQQPFYLSQEHTDWAEAMGLLLGSELQYLALLSEQKLLLSEMEASQRVAKLGNWQWDVLTNTYTWSKEACRIYELENCLHPDLKFVQSSIHPEDRERVIQFMDDIITSEHTGYNIIYRLLLPSGKVKYVRKDSVIVKDEKGKTTLIRGIIQDISEFYHISTELSKTSNQLHITYNAVAEGVWEYHFNTREKVTSPKVWEILNIDERVIHSLYELIRLIHRDERNVVLDAIRKLRNNESHSLNFDFRLNPKFVTNIFYIDHWFQCQGKVVAVNSFGETEKVAGILTDITETVSTVQQLNLAKTVFDNTSECIVITDSNNHIVTVNESFETVTGYSCEEVIGKDPRILASGFHDKAFYEEMWDCVEHTGQWKGQLYNRRKNGNVYPEEMTINKVEDDNHEVVNYVGVFHDISVRQQTEKELLFYANNDALTTLMNRRCFTERVEQEINSACEQVKKGGCNQEFSVLFIDLDDFKSINDLYGHDVGDKLLKHLAEILLDFCSKETSVCRYGGDEFAILLKDKSSSYAKRYAQKLMQALSQPIFIDELQFNITISIGISTYPESGETHQALLKNADYAMYEQKRNGRNGISIYDAQLQSEYIRKLRLKDRLIKAIAEKKIQVYYQPIVDIETGKICKFEALTRWFDEEEGYISPIVFIEMAETYGLIGQLGRVVFEQACRDLAYMHQKGYTDICMSINRSVREFAVFDQKYIYDIIDEHGLAYDKIMIEITESAALDEGNNILELLSEFAQKGICIAIDDFGTGYSSMSAIIANKPNVIKIDRNFIVDIEQSVESQILVSLVMDMSRKLHLDVVAEGVETKAQLQLLSKMGCHYIQGFYFSPAVNIDAAMVLLKQSNVCAITSC